MKNLPVGSSLSALIVGNLSITCASDGVEVVTPDGLGEEL